MRKLPVPRSTPRAIQGPIRTAGDQQAGAEPFPPPVQQLSRAQQAPARERGLKRCSGEPFPSFQAMHRLSAGGSGPLCDANKALDSSRPPCKSDTYGVSQGFRCDAGSESRSAPRAGVSCNPASSAQLEKAKAPLCATRGSRCGRSRKPTWQVERVRMERPKEQSDPDSPHGRRDRERDSEARRSRTPGSATFCRSVERLTRSATLRG
eukprot:scaffold8033_cov267-Pinguiococcus_pyrenoidosus.AAC.2